MKKISVLILSALLLASACKEGTNKNKDTKEKTSEEIRADHYLAVYDRSMELTDLSSAIYSLNAYFEIVGDSIRDSSPYLDTLILLYQEVRQFAPVYKLTDERLAQNPNDTNMLVLNVGVAQVLGGLGQVTDRCLKLVNMFPDEPGYKFNYAASLVENRKIEEGEKVLIDIANDPKSANQQVPFTAYDANGQPRQNAVNAKVGAYMKLGQLYEILKDNQKAMGYYRKALAVDGNFRPAAQAILALKSSR
jgi:tetratricopeptide (TPR) repeat protein